MSLNWDARECKRLFDEKQKGKLKKEYANLVWPISFGCMVIGLRQITKKNINEWIARWNAASRYAGPWFTLGETKKPLEFTRETLEPWIGFKTNATDCSPKKFVEKMLSTEREKLERELRKARFEVECEISRLPDSDLYIDLAVDEDYERSCDKTRIHEWDVDRLWDEILKDDEKYNAALEEAQV